MDRTALLDLLTEARQHHENLHKHADLKTAGPSSYVAREAFLAIEPLIAVAEFLLKEER